MCGHSSAGNWRSDHSSFNAAKMSRDTKSGASEPHAARELAWEVLSRLEHGTINVSSATGSMVPMLRGGETLAWMRLDHEPIVGQLMLYRLQPAQQSGAASESDSFANQIGQQLVVHRVIQRVATEDQPLWRTKGDGRPAADVEMVALADILGIVIALQRGDSWIELQHKPARYYGRIVAISSLMSSKLFTIAQSADGLLRRLVPPLKNRWVLRWIAWRCQQATHLLLHGIFFRVCHARIAPPRWVEDG